jgi:hypothetical protein
MLMQWFWHKGIRRSSFGRWYLFDILLSLFLQDLVLVDHVPFDIVYPSVERSSATSIRAPQRLAPVLLLMSTPIFRRCKGVVAILPGATFFVKGSFIRIVRLYMLSTVDQQSSEVVNKG